MVHADGDVAGRRQVCGSGLGLSIACDHVRQGGLIDHPLMCLHPRDVSVAEERNPVGPHGKNLLDRTAYAIERLKRQPIQNVEVDRGNADCAHAIDHSAGLLGSLNAVYCGLDDGIEVLNANARAGDPGGGEAIVTVVRHVVRINLDAERRLRVDAKGGSKHGRQVEQVDRSQHRGRSAAEMYRRHPPPAIQLLGDVPDLCGQRREIGGDGLVTEHLLCMAAAEPAEAVTEGDMEVERERRLGRQLAQPPCIGAGVDAIVKVRGRRLARVPWNRLREPADQRLVQVRHRQWAAVDRR